MLKKLQKIPKLIRQLVGSYVETDNISGALNGALKYTDTRYMDNINANVKKLKRPDRHSFQAVHMPKQMYDIQDKFLPYYNNDRTDGSIFFETAADKRLI